MPFVVDFVLQRRFFAFMDNGEQVTDSAAITAHYWLHGSYMLDLMALIPFKLLLLVAAIKHEFFVRNDDIIQQGDMERSLYIIESGRVVITAVLRAQGSAKERRGSAAASLRAARGNQHPTKTPNAVHDNFQTDRAPANRNSVIEWITVDGRNHPDVSGVGGETAAAAAYAIVVGECEVRIIKGPFAHVASAHCSSTRPQQSQ